MATASSFNPADRTPLAAVPDSDAAAIAAAVAASRAAQVAWAQRPLAERAAAVRALGQALLAQADAVARVMASETGRSVVECKSSELASLAPYLDTAIAVAKRALAPQPVRFSAVTFPGKRGIVEPVARGVVGIVAPWNYPLSNFYKSLFPALLAGNGAVLKPSEHAPRTGALLAQIAATVLPAGLVGVVHGARAAGEALVELVDAVVFTGSVASGKLVAQRAAARLVPASVELGGKDAAIVLADCDLERTALGVAQWAMHNAGHNCAAIERVYVEASIADRFVALLAKIVGKLRVGASDTASDLGPVQNEAQLAIVERHVAAAKAAGATVTVGGERVGPGLGFAPTVLDHCRDEWDVVAEETFGPVIAVVRVADADEAIARANASRFGLNGSIWTRDLARGEALARRLDVGIAYVNNHGFGGILADVPWTGTKDSGTGVAASAAAYGTFVRWRTVIVDRNKLPDPWWIPASAELGPFVDALVERGRGGGIGVLLRLAGLAKKRIAAVTALAR